MQEEFQLALFQNRKKENLFANRVIILSLSGVYNFVANLKDFVVLEVLNDNALSCRYLICLMLNEKA